MTTWADAPKIQGPPQTQDIGVLLSYVKKLADVTAKMAKDLEFILNGNVAFDNIRANGIEAKNIKAEAITAEKIQAGAVSAEKILAGAVTAEKIDVDELSAISADLGHIIAGLIEAVQIFGSYIATSQSYPRAEMSNTDNMFNVWASEGKGIQMKAFKSGSPFIDFVDGPSTASVYYGNSSGLDIMTLSGRDITINSGENIYLSSIGSVNVRYWDDVKNTWGENLQDALDEKMNYSQGAVNMTFDPTTRNLKLWSGNSTLLAQVNIP